MSKKLFTLLSILVLASMMLAGCGSPAPVAPAATTAPAAPVAPAATTAPAAPVAPPTSAPAATTAPVAAPTTVAAPKADLVLGSWRVDDVDAWTKIIAEFNKQYPTITIKFDPTNPPDYNATLQTQLTTGTGPDLLFVRSFEVGRGLFSSGYLTSLKTLPGLSDAFDTATLAPWASDSGDPFAVPIAAVSNGIFYNQDVFTAQGIAVPKTWEDLMAAAKKLKAAGITPFSNGLKDEWDINEVVWMGLVPSVIGGLDGRTAYLNGGRCFNDASMLASFQEIADLKPYLPNGFAAIGVNDAENLFIQGKAAMMFDGSWSTKIYEQAAPSFKWSVFQIPGPAGKDLYETFHIDAAIGMNAATKNPEAAKIFLQWLETKDFNDTFANNVPGFFPMSKTATTITDPIAATFLTFNQQAKGTDIRFTWDSIMSPPSGMQSAYNLALAGEDAILKGQMTPQQAADSLQTGLAAWYAPAKTCKK
jgi:raffinose/stachyose/melibiose transport system substrate-binding protein